MYGRNKVFAAILWLRDFARVFFISFFASFFAFMAQELYAADLPELIRKCAPNVHPVTMGALVQHESGRNPYAILDNGNGRLPKKERVMRSYRLQTEAEAIALAKKLIATGHIIDMGLAQINNRNLRWLGLTVEQIFNPCTNLQASQTIITNHYAMAVKRYGPGEHALYAALSAYNTGNFLDGFTNGYVHKVLQASTLTVPELRALPTPFKQLPLRNLANTINKKRLNTNSRKSRALEAKFSTIEVENF